MRWYSGLAAVVTSDASLDYDLPPAASTPMSIAEQLLSSPRVAQVVTLEPDGSPQVSLDWVAYLGGEIVAAELARRRKVVNILRDPRVAVSVPMEGTMGGPLPGYAVFYGLASVTSGGAARLLRCLVPATDRAHGEHADVGNDDGYVIHISLQRLGGSIAHVGT